MMDGVTKVPVACSLTAVDAQDRITEWRTFFDECADAASREQGQLRLRLRPDNDSLLAAVDLSEREKACCRFFSFAIDIDADARWLRITVPPEARQVLEDFVQLLPPALSS